MIASVSGKVIAVGENNLVVDVGGVGLLVHVPLILTKKTQADTSIFLYTELVVREDSLNLYGFENPEEREFFVMLLGVNGIGPRTALAAISTLSVDLIRRAVLHEQPEIFSRIPGVGKKGAQKILLHLQGKVTSESPLEAVTGTDVDVEILDALTSLGYSVVEAQAALQFIPKDAPDDLENRLRIALSYFAK